MPFPSAPAAPRTPACTALTPGSGSPLEAGLPGLGRGRVRGRGRQTQPAKPTREGERRFPASLSTSVPRLRAAGRRPSHEPRAPVPVTGCAARGRAGARTDSGPRAAPPAAAVWPWWRSDPLSLNVTCEAGRAAEPASQGVRTHPGLQVTQPGLTKPCPQIRWALITNRTWLQEVVATEGGWAGLRRGPEGHSPEHTLGSGPSWGSFASPASTCPLEPTCAPSCGQSPTPSPAAHPQPGWAGCILQKGRVPTPSSREPPIQPP